MVSRVKAFIHELFIRNYDLLVVLALILLDVRGGETKLINEHICLNANHLDNNEVFRLTDKGVDCFFTVKMPSS